MSEQLVKALLGNAKGCEKFEKLSKKIEERNAKDLTTREE